MITLYIGIHNAEKGQQPTFKEESIFHLSCEEIKAAKFLRAIVAVVKYLGEEIIIKEPSKWEK